MITPPGRPVTYGHIKNLETPSYTRQVFGLSHNGNGYREPEGFNRKLPECLDYNSFHRNIFHIQLLKRLYSAAKSEAHVFSDWYSIKRCD